MALGLFSDSLLETWAASSELGSRIQALKTQLLLAHGMLDCARGGADGIRNSALEELLLELRQLAYSADDMLDELEYFRIQDKLEGTDRTTDLDGQGLIHGLVLNARHTARDVASKLKLSSCSCAAAANHGDPGKEQEDGKQGCIPGACSRGGQKAPEITSSPPPSPPTNHGDQEADGGCMAKVIPASARDAARAVGKRLPCYSFPSVHDDAPTSMSDGSNMDRKLKFDRVEMSKKMADIVKQLKSVCEMVSTILVCSNPLTITQAAALDRRPKTTPLIIEPILYGRENLVKHVVDDITGKYSSDNLTVLSFVGPGGIGKTTFTQHIYEQMESHFQVLVWVCVSHDFDANRLAQEIVKQIPKGHDEKQNASDEEKIKIRLQSKQFLIVLDDMWKYREDEWKKLLALFRKGEAKGNIVIVTTRTPAVAQMVVTKNICPIKLERLGDEDCMLLFKACVFDDEQSWKDHPDLHDVGRDIVRKLKGFPLAVKTVGRVLKRRLNLDYWTRVLERKEWEREESEDDIMPALKLSYNYLRFDLQQCFSHCALFPEDYKFRSEELIHLWIGLGLLDYKFRSDEKERTEDIGQDSLADLVDNGFFDRVEKENGCPYYVIHDLLHELAVNVSSQECLNIHSSNVRSIQIPASVRHLSVTVDDTDVNDRMTFENVKRDFTTLQKKLKAENLRTLMLFGEHHGSFAKTFSDLFREAKALRVIFLCGASYNVEDLLHKFSKLVHLRYLRIKDSRHTRASLPSSISRFYNLIVLDVQQCNVHLGFLRDMNNLVKIRHFLVSDDEFHSDIPEVGKLKFLQELRRFEVKKEKNGFALKQLERLQQLQGSLGIYNLEKIEAIKEANEAKLVQMNHLHRLTLAWDTNRSNKDPKQEESVLESLKAHSNLHELCIEGHGGHTSPTWLGVDLCIKNLESLHLRDVAWDVLPLVGKLCMANDHGRECPGCVTGQGFQNLRRLELTNIPRLKNWCGNDTSHFLSRLEELIVKHCSELIELPFSRFTCSQPKQEENMSKLRRLEISNCPKLRSLPPIPWTCDPCSAQIKQVGLGLEQLSYKKDRESKPRLYIEGKDALDNTFWNVLYFNNLTELVELSIKRCPLVPLDHIRMLAALKYLDISECAASGKDLTRLLTHFPNLSRLEIWRCENVTGLAVVEQEQQAGGEEAIEAGAEEGLLLLPPQIQELEIHDCPELILRKTAAAAAGGLQGLRSLRSLEIWDCPKFLPSNSSSSSSFPFPSSLQKLSLTGVEVEGTWTLPPLANLNYLCIMECGDLRGESLWPLLAQGNLAKLVVYKSPKFFISGSEPSGQYEQDLHLQELYTDDIAGALAAPICHLLSSSLTKLLLQEVEVFTKEQEQALRSLTSLQELQIVFCDKLRSLPAELSRLPNLKRLKIFDCPAIRSLPKDGFPTSLQELDIGLCPAIRSLPKDALPSSLRLLDVRHGNSEELRTQCRKLKGTIPIIYDYGLY